MEPVLFGRDGASVPEPDPNLLGRKGAGLIAMCGLGLPVPPGFILPTTLGASVARGESVLDADWTGTLDPTVAALEGATGRTFGRGARPLLVSVRSGAAVSMPGMMDTVLNIGLNDETTAALATETGDERFALDCRRRFLQGFATVVLDVSPDLFEDVLEELRAEADVETDAELEPPDLRRAIARFTTIVSGEAGNAFPDDPREQLRLAVMAVFHSWNTDRARRYRQLQGIDENGGTAAVVQAMVFGNRGAGSATGVMTTRNPSTGEAAPYGEFMLQAQGEDIVSGLHTPAPLTERARLDLGAEAASMERTLPKEWGDLREAADRLEAHFRTPQEIEFTVEDGALMLLQTRDAKLTDRAALRVAVEMAQEGRIERREAVARCGEEMLAPLLVLRARPSASDRPWTRGLPASPGAAVGELVFTSKAAEASSARGRTPILLRPETDPRDVHGMAAAGAIVTTRGGMTSHAAVVARAMGKPCVTAATSLRLDQANEIASAAGVALRAGDTVTVDGGTGMVFAGKVPLEEPVPSGHLATILQWREELDAEDG